MTHIYFNTLALYRWLGPAAAARYFLRNAGDACVLTLCLFVAVGLLWTN